MIIFDIGVYTDGGQYRAVNEDSFLLCGRAMSDSKRGEAHGIWASKRKFGVAAVFDGMGGAKYGDVASGLAAELLSEYMEDILNQGRDGVASFVERANASICRESRTRAAPMGSTMVLVAVSDECAEIYNIGDSRAYLVREGQLTQLTKDHTVAASLHSIGIDNKAGERRHQLTQHLGIPADEIVIQAFSMGTFALLAGDKILLCSDGVTDGLSDEELLALLSRNKGVAELSRDIVRGAAQGGSRDNITAMVLTFSDDGKPAKRYPRPDAESASPEAEPTGGSIAPSQTRAAPDIRSIPPDIRISPDVRFTPDVKSVMEPPRLSRTASPDLKFPPPLAGAAGGEVKRDRFALFWLCNLGLALALGFVLGIIYSLI